MATNNLLLRQKYYQYKSFSPSGSYLGLIQNVTSDYSHNLLIGTAFVQTQITVGVSADVVGKANSQILDENSNPILDEANNPILDEGVADIVGSVNTNAQIANNNLIQVWEYSQYYPNGLLVFSGYISKWKATFGSTDDILITAISNGQDLNNNLVLGGNTLDQSQLLQNTNDTIFNSTKGSPIFGAQSFTVGAGITSLSAITVMLNDNNTPNQSITLYVTTDSGFSSVIGTVTRNITTGGVAQAITFTLPTPITVTPGTVYYFILEPAQSSGILLYYQNSGGVVGKQYYQWENVGGGSELPSPTSYCLYFETWYVSSPNSVPFVNDDVSFIMNTIMASYIAAGGLVGLPSGGFPNTGNLTTYTFKTQTMLQAIQTLDGLAPTTWYWYVDPATNLLVFAQANTVADIVLIKGRHISELDIEATRENIKNNVYFTGGDDGTGTSHNIFVQVQNALNNNRVGLALISDNRVNSTAGGVSTALQIAQEYANDNNAETYITNVTIPDGTMDTNLFKPGKMIGFAGFTPFVNNLLLQCVGVQKSSDSAIVALGTLPIRPSQAIADIEAGLAYLQTVANPTTAV